MLQADSRFFDSEGNLLRNKLFEASNKMDKSLLTLLLSDNEVKEKLFVDINGTLIFDSQQFNFIINNRAFFKNSYTSYKNKIGLATKENDLITAKNDVTLIFPYKDKVIAM